MRQWPPNIYRHAPCWMEEIIVTTHLRIAAGVCALSIGLLVGGGGAVALADGTDAGPPNQGGAVVGGQDAPSTDGPASTIGNQRIDEAPGQDVTNTDPTASDDEPTDRQGPTSTVEAQTYSSDDQDEGTGAGASNSSEEAGTTPSTESNTAPLVSDPPASESDVAPPAPAVPASDASPPAPAPTVAAAPVPPPPPMTVTTNVVAPKVNAFVNFARAMDMDTVQATLAGLPTSKNPVIDLVNILSSVAGAGVALPVPNDLYALLGIPQTVQPSLIGGGGALDTAARAPKDAPLFGPRASRLPQTPAAAKDAPLFGTVVHASNVGSVATSSLNEPLSLSGLAPVPAGVSPATRSFLDNVVSSVLVAASLTALAAIAVPGLGGLLIVCAAGVRIGYRQAKAGLAVRVAGIARFAGPGPLGVVRSGSLITLHPRIARVDRPRAASAVRAKTAHATRHLEKVA
jgi:hypothetical protein